eukprot:13850419-Ditylum_brightwellii.AAC.1
MKHKNHSQGDTDIEVVEADVDWFHFDGGTTTTSSLGNGGIGVVNTTLHGDEFLILTTTRLLAPSYGVTSPSMFPYTDTMIEISCFSLEESVNLLLHGADEDDECNDDKEKEEKEAFSPNF